MSDMKKFFHPKSIAIVGASQNPDNLGHDVLENLLLGEAGRDRSNGYQGKVHPVSLKYDEVLGLKACRRVLDISGLLDLAVLIIPSKAIPQVMEECGQKGCKNVVIISAGFREHGEEGKKREQHVVEIARKHGIRFIGPNCLGVFSTYEQLNASFAPRMPDKGPVAMISQSGALCTAIIAYAKQEHIGFSNFVSSGNKADVEDSDLIEYFNEDPLTKVTAIYMESINDGRRFFDIAKQIAVKTPIVILKVGKTEAGKKAASSHTGALAGADWAYEAAFRQAGIIRVATMYELFDASRAFAYQPIPNGENIAILTNSGGPGVIASDTAFEIGLPLAELSSDTKAKFDAICPPTWSHGNPIDIIGDADVNRYMKCLDVLLDAPEVDGIVLIAAPVTMADPLTLAKSIAERAKNTKKPIIANFVGVIGEESEDYLEAAGVPTIEFPERAVRAMHSLVRFKRVLDREILRKKQKEPTPGDVDPHSHKRCEEIFKKVRIEGRRLLTLNEAREIFELLGLPMSKSRIATSEEEAVRFCEELGFPLAMKISSKDIVHKTEAGGVKLNVTDTDEAKKAFRTIIKNVRNFQPDARVEGVVIDQMVSGSETIIGVSSDPQFGPMVMFGLGGTMVEVYKDVTFRLIPLTKIDALEMLEEIKGKASYQGARGQPAADPDELAELIVRVSEAVSMHPDIQELDANPLIVSKDGLVAVDARILIRE
jgi:acetyl coenzyme A synthetase (ADP forming)-like protein